MISWLPPKVWNSDVDSWTAGFPAQNCRLALALTYKLTVSWFLVLYGRSFWWHWSIMSQPWQQAHNCTVHGDLWRRYLQNFLENFRRVFLIVLWKQKCAVVQSWSQEGLGFLWSISSFKRTWKLAVYYSAPTTTAFFRISCPWSKKKTCIPCKSHNCSNACHFNNWIMKANWWAEALLHMFTHFSYSVLWLRRVSSILYFPIVSTKLHKKLKHNVGKLRNKGMKAAKNHTVAVLLTLLFVV